jgi:hypothetical protein
VSNFERTKLTENEIAAWWAMFGPPPVLSSEAEWRRGNKLAMLQGVETMQPPLADFYNSLSDDQKARFNSMGRQLFAQKNATNE